MSVSINYKGRGGNKIFQYVSARIFSEKNKINLTTSLDCDILKTTDTKRFEEKKTANTIEINHKSFINDDIPCKGDNVNYLFNDYFQNCVFINNNIDIVETFFDLPSLEKNTEDIVLHIRLDDKVHCQNLSNPESWNDAEIIHPDYYIKILETETYKNVYIVVDEVKYDWEKKYMSMFEKYNPKIITQKPKEDFEFIRKFNKIVTSTSTFSYWAAFFSDAEKIYTFEMAGLLGKNLRSHGPHVKELWNIKNKSITINEKFYFGI